MLKQYRLAASARTNDRGNLALRTVEIDAVEDLLYAETAAKIAHDDRHGLGFLRFRRPMAKGDSSVPVQDSYDSINVQ